MTAFAGAVTVTRMDNALTVDYTAEDAAALVQLARDIAIVHAHCEAEQAICAGKWPFTCPYCHELFQTGDRWFPYCGAQCGINAGEDR